MSQFQGAQLLAEWLAKGLVYNKCTLCGRVCACAHEYTIVRMCECHKSAAGPRSADTYALLTMYDFVKIICFACVFVVSACVLVHK